MPEFNFLYEACFKKVFELMLSACIAQESQYQYSISLKQAIVT